MKCRHMQGKTAHQLESCLGGGSAGEEEDQWDGNDEMMMML